MSHIQLTPRLQAVADLVPQGCRFADIGTDHAYLPVWLLQQGRITSAIAGDLRQGPLDHARATAGRYGYTGQIHLRLGDGLAALAPHEVDCVAIAGMGGEAIRSILAAAPWTKTGTRLILQPQTNLPELRQWLTGAGYQIRADYIIREESRWYTVLLVAGGRDETGWTPGTLLAGRPDQWADCPERRAHLAFLLDRTEKQLHGLTQAEQPDQNRLQALTQARGELEEMLRAWTEGA